MAGANANYELTGIYFRMESTILLNSNENTRQIEEEEKSRFVRDIMDSLGLPVEGLWDEEGNLSIESKIKLREILIAYNLQVIADPEGRLEIYHHDEGTDVLIGEWRKPQYFLKRDYSQKDPKKKLYLEMKVSYWSIFENT